MFFMMRFFFTMPFWLRAAVFFLLVFVLWRFLGRAILWLLSGFPFLLQKLFLLIYYMTELPITILHKKFGGNFYKADKAAARFFGRIDSALNRWYHAWHSKYQFNLKKAIPAYCLLLIIIIAPSFVPGKNKVLSIGETIYLSGENFVISLLEKQEEYLAAQKKMEDSIGQKETETQIAQNAGIIMIVYGVKSSLLVRDLPDVNKGITLDRLKNEDRVEWTGELVFAETENNKIEPWVKVKTEGNIEGWSRMYYLYPEAHEELELYADILTSDIQTGLPALQ